MQRLGQVLGERALETDTLAGGWVRERQTLRVEREPIEAELGAIRSILAAFRVPNVAGDRVVDASEVATDLVTAAGARSCLDE